MESEITPQHFIDIDGIYRYYKGGLYKVLSIATHTETKKMLVIYKSTENHSLVVWARPVHEFCGVVPDKNCLRFTPVSLYRFDSGDSTNG